MNSHPDAEALSAFLDGEAPDVSEHVATCTDCRRQIDALAGVRAAVASPVSPPDPDRKEAAIAAAVQSATSPRDRRRFRAFVAAGAVAAAVVVGLVVTRVSTSHTSSTSSGPVASNIVRAGDLGDINDDLALRAAVETALPSAASNRRGAASVGGDNESATGNGASAGAAGVAGPANPTPGPSVTALPTRPVAGPRQPPRCEVQARQLDAKGAELTYEATARWQGTPADVFGFSPAGAPTSSPGRPPPTRVYVLARSDCHLLVFQSYAP
jgi:hypothetical protein